MQLLQGRKCVVILQTVFTIQCSARNTIHIQTGTWAFETAMTMNALVLMNFQEVFFKKQDLVTLACFLISLCGEWSKQNVLDIHPVMRLLVIYGHLLWVLVTSFSTAIKVCGPLIVSLCKLFFCVETRSFSIQTQKTMWNGIWGMACLQRTGYKIEGTQNRYWLIIKLQVPITHRKVSYSTQILEKKLM